MPVGTQFIEKDVSAFILYQFYLEIKLQLQLMIQKPGGAPRAISSKAARGKWQNLAVCRKLAGRSYAANHGVRSASD